MNHAGKWFLPAKLIRRLQMLETRLSVAHAHLSGLSSKNHLAAPCVSLWSSQNRVHLTKVDYSEFTLILLSKRYVVVGLDHRYIGRNICI